MKERKKKKQINDNIPGGQEVQTSLFLLWSITVKTNRYQMEITLHSASHWFNVCNLQWQ